MERTTLSALKRLGLVFDEGVCALAKRAHGFLFLLPFQAFHLPEGATKRLNRGLCAGDVSRPRSRLLGADKRFSFSRRIWPRLGAVPRGGEGGREGVTLWVSLSECVPSDGLLP